MNKKNYRYSIILALFSAIVFNSCGIKVDKGPFEINDFEDKLEGKKEYLQSITNTIPGKKTPNVIVILVDDLGKHDLRLYHEDGIRTPYIESLASEGVIFDHAYSSSPVCSPSRAALLTGRYQQRYGFERQPMNRYSRNRMEYFFVDHLMNVEPMRLISPMAKVPTEEIKKQGMPGSEILLPEIMQKAGYQTGICGKWHLGLAEDFIPNNRGFNYQYGFYEAFSLYSPIGTPGIVDYRHDYFANKHIWKQKRKESCAIRINDQEIHEEEYLTFAIARHSIDFIDEHKEKPFFLLSAFSAPHTPFQAPEEYYNRFRDIEDKNKRIYFAMIAALDDAIGMILNHLDSIGLAKNTLIFFASDNGGATYTEATDNGKLKAGKFSQFEGGVNIPMILKWEEGIKSTGHYNAPVCLLDIMPTILQNCDIPLATDRKTDGSDLICSINNNVNPHEFLYWRTDFNKAIRDSRWKLIWNTKYNQCFLYDLSIDNYEQVNLAEEFPDEVNRLKKQYESWEKETIEPLWPGVMEFKFDIDGEVTWWAI